MNLATIRRVVPALALFSLFAHAVAAMECPDPSQRSVEIGGHSISGALIASHKGVPGASVELRSSRKVLWKGTTDKDGLFEIPHLRSGAYTLKVENWGQAPVRLNPKLDRPFNNQTAYWHLLLSDGGCISWRMDMN